jgi:hypothetical protein
MPNFVPPSVTSLRDLASYLARRPKMVARLRAGSTLFDGRPTSCSHPSVVCANPAGGRTMRSACAPIAGGPGQSMPKLTCAPRKLAWAPMARNVVWLVPSCLQRLSRRVRGPVKLVAGRLIYTAWGSNSSSAARVFGDWERRETGLAQHMREPWPSAVAADRDSIQRSARWQKRLRRRGRSWRISLAAPAKTDVKTDIAKSYTGTATARRATTTRCCAQS